MVLCAGATQIQDTSAYTDWDETFSKAYATAEKERGYLSTFSMWLFKKAFKMTLPGDDTNCARYEMKRAPQVYLDILYADGDLRITRANRGTVVIVQKAKE